MSTVNSLLENSAQGFEQQQSVAKKLAGKWSKSGLLEGLQGYEKTNMAVMLEQQAKRLVVESAANLSGGGVTNGATFSTGVGEQWAGIALPLVRKIFGMIAAKEFVSVQPMNLPAGLIFYLDFQYVNNKAPFADGNSLFGTRTTSNGASFGNLAEGGLYGAGRFGYSINQFSASYSSSLASVTVASASFSDVNYDANFSSSLQGGDDTSLKLVQKITVPTSSLTDFDVNSVRSFIISSGSVTAAKNLQAYTRLSGGNLVFFVTASAAEAAKASGANQNYVVYYSKQTDFNKRGDFEDSSSSLNFAVPNAASDSQIVIPEIKIQMQSEGIVAKTRKLKAEWTPELAQDLEKFQNIDAEAELTSMLGEYIALEIDLEILDMLIQNASAGTEIWSAVANKFWNSSTGTYSIVAAGAGGYYNTQGEWFQTLGTKLQKLSNIIHQRTLRGGANFMMVSPAISTILESIPGFAADVNGETESMKYAFGVQKIGQLNSRYKVYKNPYLTENLILLGLRGSQFLETGAVYAPYVPLIMTPLVYDPETFTPRKGLMTRYAKKMVRPEFYAKVYVTDLNTL